MDTYEACLIADGTEEPKDQAEYLAAFQLLVDTGLAWQLQGTIGREAARLIQSGKVKQTVHGATDFYGSKLPWQPDPNAIDASSAPDDSIRQVDHEDDGTDEPMGYVTVDLLAVLLIVGLALAGWMTTLAFLTAFCHLFIRS